MKLPCLFVIYLIFGVVFYITSATCKSDHLVIYTRIYMMGVFFFF